MSRKIYDLFRRSIPRPIRPALRAPAGPRPGHSQFSCLVIGEGALTVQCCDILLSRGHDVTAIVTSNPEIIHLVDGGRILKQQSVPIANDETAYSLNTKCFEAGMQSFAELVQEIESGSCQAFEQDLSQRTYFGMYDRPAAACALLWEKPAAELTALVRGLEFGPYPNPMGRAKMMLRDEFVLCPHAEVVESLTAAPVGTVTAIEADHIQVATGAGSLRIHQLLTLDGTPLPLRHAIQQFGLTLGTRLPGLDAPLRQRISTFHTRICRHESFWVRRLQKLNPVSLPYRESPTAERSERFAFRD